LLVPIIGIGLYPKLATRTYDVKTVEVAHRTQAAIEIVARQSDSEKTLQASSPGMFYAPAMVAPALDR